MFAVPGWSLSAPLKAQTESSSNQKSNSEEAKSKSRKRKRPTSQPVQNVTTDNLATLWEEHIEQKALEPKQKKKKQKNRGKEDLKPQEADAQEKSDIQKTLKPSNDENPTKPQHDPTEPQNKKSKTKKKNKPPKNSNKPTTDQKQPTAPLLSPSTTPINLTPLQTAMTSKLSSARFRHLNQHLYTHPSASSQSLFASSPDLFAAYHAGFRQQVSVWPSNPLDGFIADVRRRARNASLPQLRERGLCVIADLGCGDAKLASALVGDAQLRQERRGEVFSGEKRVGGVTVRVYSFDLQSTSPLVMAADIAALPLASESVDVAVFCLALMGTNWPAFVDEAWRVLAPRGEVWIAEIKSRFGRTKPGTKKIGTLKEGGKPGPKGKNEQKRVEKEKEMDEQDAILASVVDGEQQGDSTDLSAFIELLRSRGFDIAGPERESVDTTNKMFVKMRFVKVPGRVPTRGKNAGTMGTGGNKNDGEERSFGRVKKKKKFLENVDNEVVPEEEEAKILKPCVYKLR
jgi:ribosomal RNA-processing protein 8